MIIVRFFPYFQFLINFPNYIISTTIFNDLLFTLIILRIIWIVNKNSGREDINSIKFILLKSHYFKIYSSICF